ncbi:MAG: GFA family protein [Pseudaminobacter sp.]|nr:GFA family protein [Pseudaminobacter sp.]
MVVGGARQRAGGRNGSLSGNCMCGSVTWIYTGETTRNLVCHCSDCQRATSSPFTAFLGMNPEQLQWIGKIEHYKSSPGTYRGFCPSCGTRLYFRSEKWPEESHVHAATLTNPNEHRPDAQVVMRSRAGWLDHLKSIPGHEDFHTQPANPTDIKKKA